MKIIIAGAGKIGNSLAEILVSEGHDITVIDRDPDTIQRISNTADVICVEGNATNPGVLEEAGAAHADLLLAVTEMDEINMVCGAEAKKLGTGNVIARVREIEYLSHSSFLRETLGLSLIINPEYECAKEISRILRMPGADRIEAFPKSNAEIVEFRFESGSVLNGMKISDLPEKTGSKVLIAAIERDGEVIIPCGSDVIAADDRLSVVGSAPEMRKFFVGTGEYIKPSKNVLIMGGGRISVYLAKLLRENDMKATIIEMDRELCEDLADELPGTEIICGDATKNGVIAESGIEQADAFVALTGDDGDNIVTSMYAQSVGTAKVVTKVDRSHYLKMLGCSQLECVVAPRVIIAERIAKYVRGLVNSKSGKMETMYRIAGGRAEAVEFIVGEKCRCAGKAFKEMKLVRNVLVGIIIRNSRVIIPGGNDMLLPGDHAVFIAAPGLLKEPDDILEDSL